MAFPSETFISAFTAAAQVVGDELRHYYSQMTAWLGLEHDENGHHTDITATSVTVTGDLSVDGSITADADGNPIVLDSEEIFGPGIRMTHGTAADWRLTAVGGANRAFYFTDKLATDAAALEIVATNIGGTIDYTLLPHVAATRWFLGQDVGSQRWIEVNALVVRANTAYYERGRSAPIGEWTAIAWNSANFTASGAMIWTVGNTDQITYAYALVGKTMGIMVTIQSASNSGTPDTTLKIAVPGGGTIAKQFTTVGAAIADAGASGVHEPILVTGVAGGTTIDLFRLGAAVWPNSINQQSVWFCVTIEVQ